MKRLLMAEQWDSYARAVLPSGCSTIQRIETRRAFYAGAQAIFHGVIATFTPESEVTADDLQIMADLDRELSDFAEMVKAGRA